VNLWVTQGDSIKNRIFIVLLLLIVILQSCNNAGSVQVEHEDLRTEVDQQGIVLEKLSVKAWKGSGNGGEATEFKGSVSGPVYFAEGKGGDAQTVIASGELKVKLHAGYYYELSTEVNAQGVGNYFDFIAAMRTGKNRDVFEKYSGIDAWTTVTLLFNPAEDVVPEYFAIRLYGQGKVFSKPFSLREITKEEYEQKKKTLAADKVALNQKRLEKEFLPYTPSLPLPTSDSPDQFKIWGTLEESFPPLPFGWRRLPGEQTVVESVVTERIKNAEYLTFTKPATIPIYQESFPRAIDLVSRLSSEATPGEYKPLNFAVYAAKRLTGVRVWITDLKSDNGQVIKSTNIDIRTVNFVRKIKDKYQRTYFLMPLTLGKGPDSVDEKTSRRYWLTVLVPPKASPGVYRGKIQIKPDNALATSIPVEFTVLPFTVLDPPIVRFMWGPPKSKYADNDFKIYQDMVAHGFSAMMLGGEVKTRDQKIGKEDIDNIVQSIDAGQNTNSKLGFRDKPIGGISNNQIIYYWDKSLNWFRYWPLTPELDKQFVSAYRDVYMQYDRANKRSKLLHYIVDEPGGANPKNLEPAQHYLKLLKKELPTLKTFVTIGGGMKQGYDEVSMLSPYLDVTCTNYVTKEVIDRLDTLHSEFWIYNGSSLNLEPIKERFFYGWYAWKIGAKGIGQWTYAWTDSPFTSDFRDERQDYALETKRGYLPTVGLEMIREGIDDYRYLYTLSKLIQHGLQSRDTTMNQKARNAGLQLAAMREKVNLNYLRGSDVPESKIVGLSAESLDSFRGKLAFLINDLALASNSTWEVLLEKLKHEPEIPFLKPTEKDWQKSYPGNVSGKDMLAESRFGGMTTDWKMQIWKGKGGGNFETGTTHQGHKTGQLYITSIGKDDNGALILHKPDVLLKKGTRYRLSAWMKTEAVTQRVNLYAAVRSGGMSDIGSEALTGTTDWRHVWIDISPEEDCKAQYFAVRLWGQGTVYFDRITLQAL